MEMLTLPFLLNPLFPVPCNTAQRYVGSDRTLLTMWLRRKQLHMLETISAFLTVDDVTFLGRHSAASAL